MGKKTDKDKLIALLSGFGINPLIEGNKVTLCGFEDDSGPMADGYPGFYIDYNFDDDGKFIGYWIGE